MSHFAHARQTFAPGARKVRVSLLASAARDRTVSAAVSRLPVEPPHRARVAAPQLRRQTGQGGRRPGARRVAAARRAHRRDPLRRRAHRPAGLHRASRCSSTSPPCARPSSGCRRDPQVIEPLVPGRPRRRPLGPGRRVVDARRPAPQHGDRVPAQPRPLRVPEVGHAGLPRLRRRAAGHRHRPPGQPRVPRAGRPRARRRLLPRHARRHRLAHDDDQRPRHRRAGASAASRPRPGCSGSRCTS